MPSQLPVALTIAGSDSGGGAGIQADLKTFSALGVFGTSAITAITAQNPDGVTAIQGIDPDVVAAQVDAVLTYFPVAAVKTGMLFSQDIISAVAEMLRKHKIGTAGNNRVPLVIDPVMVATSGAKLLNDDAVAFLTEKILPLASLVTPNTDEALILSGNKIQAPEDLEPAAKAVFKRYKVPVLIKGGHLEKVDSAQDLLWDGTDTELLKTPFLQNVGTHGTGCTLSSAITVFLMRGHPLVNAVAEGKAFLQQALSHSLPGGSGIHLNHGFAPVPLAGI